MLKFLLKLVKNLEKFDRRMPTSFWVLSWSIGLILSLSHDNKIISHYDYVILEQVQKDN